MTDAELLERLSRLSPQELAELDALLLRPETPLFRDWLPQVSPTYRWDWPHLRYLQDRLQRVADGSLKRLIISCPPRHGKTEQGTVRYPVYRLVQNLHTRVIIAAYNATLARKFSRKARRIARALHLPLSTERDAAEEWETLQGGGVRAVGVGEGVTGQGADLILIDDPVKSREEAESEVYRDKTYDWYTDDLYSRCEPNAAIVITMTRWHEDDLVGRILASEDAGQWEVVNLPALAEANDPLGRTEGQALCPDRYDETALAGIQRVQTAYSFGALYQGHPTAREGSMFPRDRIQIVDEAPAGMNWVRFWDYAGTEGGGAYTAGVKLGMHKGLVYVLDVQRFQKAALERDNHVLATATLDKSSGNGSQWLEQEPGSAGKDAAARFVRMLAGHNAHHETATGDKITRAEQSGWAATWQAGNVRLLRGGWNEAYIREHESFGPGAKYKDQVDASVGAYTKAVKRPTLAAPLLDLVKESHWS